MNTSTTPIDRHPAEALRLGAVNYLNSKPLIEGLSRSIGEAELTLDFPSRLADGLSAGSLDVALIPSVECFRRPVFEIVTDACVATRGPVWSVKMYSRVPVENIQRLALDEGSRTSAALVQILLSERFGVTPSIEPFLLGQAPEESTADAILMIGDRAMHSPVERFEVVWDLGQEWTSWTGLPFVFAVWATRPGQSLGELESALMTARDCGVKSFEEIASRECEKLGLTARVAADYLRDNLHFTLGPDERAGLELFHSFATQRGLIPHGVPCVFREKTCA